MDIIYHMLAGFLIYTIAYAIGFREIPALLLVLLAGVIKELYDLPVVLNYTLQYSEPVKDIAMTIIGGVLGLFNPFQRIDKY